LNPYKRRLRGFIGSAKAMESTRGDVKKSKLNLEKTGGLGGCSGKCAPQRDPWLVIGAWGTSESFYRDVGCQLSERGDIKNK